MELIWDKQLSVGNAVIDSDHRHLMNLASKVVDVILAKDYPALQRAFANLEHWLHVHFSNEKKIAQAIGFDFSMHKQAQQYSLKELQYFRDELMAKKGIWCERATQHYAQFLHGWMTEHIARLDMPMKPMLQAFDYKFWPGGKEGETNRAAGSVASLYLRLLDAPLPCAI